MDNFLEGAYSGEVCWKLLIDDKEFSNRLCRPTSDELLDGHAILPVIEEDKPRSIDVNLVITGYK